jgi:hypothetical protein
LRWRDRVCTALLSAIAVVAVTASPGAAATPPADFFGLSAPELYSMSLDGRYALRDASLEQIEAAGIDTVRTEIGWREVEPAAPVDGVHAYNWTAIYGHVAALAAHGQALAPMIMAPPAWAQPPASAGTCQRRGGVDPSEVDDYAAFAGEIAKTFGRDGVYWRWAAAAFPELPQRPITTYEIFNEPNWDSFWCPELDPETYAAALAKAADAIHAVDPSATVSLGGLAVFEQDQYDGDHLSGMATSTFLARMTAAVPNLAARIDAVALHTYWATPADDLRALSLTEGWLDQVGLGDERLIVSEYGWRSGGPVGALTEEQRAQMIGEYTDSLARTNCDLIGIYPHSWISPRADTANPEHWYGLADPLTGAPLASGVAYGEVVESYEHGSASDKPRLDVCEPDPSAPTQPAAPPDAGSSGPADPAGLRDAAGPAVTVKRRSHRHATPVRFTLVATDPDGIARIEYRLDGRRWRASAGAVRIRRPGSGAHLLEARAFDRAGNVGEISSRRWRLHRGHRR